ADHWIFCSEGSGTGTSIGVVGGFRLAYCHYANFPLDFSYHACIPFSYVGGLSAEADGHPGQGSLSGSDMRLSVPNLPAAGGFKFGNLFVKHLIKRLKHIKQFSRPVRRPEMNAQQWVLLSLAGLLA